MTDTNTELFYLTVKLSGLHREDLVLTTLIDSLNQIFPQLGISYDPNPTSQNKESITIATQKDPFGNILLQSKPSKEEKDKIRHTASLVAIILQNLKRQKAEDQLKEIEETYRTVIENTGTATIIIEKDTTISLVNQEFTRLYGKAREEIENKMSWTHFAHPDDLERMKQHHKLRRKNPQQTPRNYEFRLLDARDKLHYIYITIDMIPGTSKSVASFLDITERKKAEQRLEESEQHFRALFHQNNSVLMLFDPKNGKIYDANNKAVEFYGYSREELLSMRVHDINTLPENKIDEEIQKAVKQEKNHFVFSHRLASGKIRDVEIYPGLITIHGKKLLYTTTHDITEETRNRHRLQKGEEIARLGHWEFDLNTDLVYASRGAYIIYGLEKKEMPIPEIQKVPLPEYREKLDKAMEDLIQKGIPYDLEFKARRPSDNEIVDIHSIAEYNKERNIIFGIIQDVTERKAIERELKRKNDELQAAEEELKASNDELKNINQRLEWQKEELEKAKEKAEESDRLKSAFLANMSHEIRTPMNGIMGFAQLLKEKETTPSQRKDYLNIIYGRTKHLLQIINDIVDISKIEANQLDIHNDHFDLNELMNNLYKEQKKELDELDKSHIQLKMTKDSRKNQFYIGGDSRRIKQVLLNLLSNAMKFTEKGTVEFGYKLENNKHITFFVKDTGAGISSKKQKEIFERFRQGDETFNRNHEGTGLGLTISKNLVELMNGSIWVHSEKKQGAAFYFTIPYIHTQEDTKKTTDINHENYQWEKINILVVEDDLASQELIHAGLSPTQANLTVCDTGKKALEKISTNKAFDVILMDIRLPDINGLEVTRQIRQSNKKTPIIAQTAHAMGEDQKKCLQAGANDYIAKPIDIHELLITINRYIP